MALTDTFPRRRVGSSCRRLHHVLWLCGVYFDKRRQVCAPLLQDDAVTSLEQIGSGFLIVAWRLRLAVQAFYQLNFSFPMFNCFAEIALQLAAECMAFSADDCQVVIGQSDEDLRQALQISPGSRSALLGIQPEVNFLADIIKLAPGISKAALVWRRHGLLLSHGSRLQRGLTSLGLSWGRNLRASSDNCSQIARASS
jgi:hypothetical protein